MLDYIWSVADDARRAERDDDQSRNVLPDERHTHLLVFAPSPRRPGGRWRDDDRRRSLRERSKPVFHVRKKHRISDDRFPSRRRRVAMFNLKWSISRRRGRRPGMWDFLRRLSHAGLSPAVSTAPTAEARRETPDSRSRHS